MDNDSEMQQSEARSGVDHELKVVQHKARLIAAAEEALARARRHTNHYGTVYLSLIHI